MYFRFVWIALFSVLLPACGNAERVLQYRVPSGLAAWPGVDALNVRFERVVPTSQYRVSVGTGELDGFSELAATVFPCDDELDPLHCETTVEALPSAETLNILVRQHPSESLHFHPLLGVELAPALGVAIDQLSVRTADSGQPITTNITLDTALVDFISYECAVEWGDGTSRPAQACTEADVGSISHTYADGTYLMRVEVTGLPEQIVTVVQIPVCVGNEATQNRCNPL